MKHCVLAILCVLAFQITTHSQTFCDSIEVLHFGYSPFDGDSALDLVVENHSSQFFNYPNFLLLDAQGDTLAEDAVFFFGLPTGTQAHRLTGFQGQGSDTVTGTLQFLTDFDSLRCEYDLVSPLCPGSAQKFYIGFGYGVSDSGSYEWSLSDSAGTLVKDGIYSKDSATDYGTDSLWLLPGEYSLSIHALSVSGAGKLHYHINGSMGIMGIFESMVGDTVRSLEIFSPCISATDENDTVNAVDSPFEGRGISISGHANTLHIQFHPNSSNRLIEVYDLQGRMVHRQKAQKTVMQVGMGDKPSGIYLVKASDDAGALVERVYVQ